MSSKNQNKKLLQQALEEESSSEESFASVSTNPNQTNYNLDASSTDHANVPSTSANMRRPTKAPQKVMPAGKKTTQKASAPPPVPSSDESSEEATQDNSRMTRNQSQQNATANRSGAQRRKAKIPQKLNTNYIGNQIPKAPFAKCVRFFMEKTTRTGDFRITGDALAALQHASEIYLTGVMGDAYQITLTRRQVTLMPRDVNVLMFLRGPGSKLGCV